MDQGHRGDTNIIPDQNAAHKQPDHLRNFQNNLQPRHPSDNDVSYQKINLTFANIILPVSFLGVTVLAILFVLVLLILWWKNFASSWKAKKKNEGLVKTMAEFEDSRVKIEVVKDAPSESEEERPNVRYVDEKEQRLRPIVTTRNYGGSSPKFPETTEQKEKKPNKFVFPPEKSDSDQSSSKSSEPSSSGSSNEDKNPKLKIPLPEQTWLNKKPFEVKTYSATIPRPLAEVVKSELGVDLNIQECRGKKFSATRSPSLEKDDKSPFVSSATYDRSEVFGFEPEAINKVSTSSSIIDVCVQPESDQAINVVNKNFNNNVTPISPIPDEVKDLRRYISNNVEHLRTSSLDVENENKADSKNTNLRRFRSVNTKLNICAAIDHSNIEAQQERSEMQNSPRILECSSANEKSSGTQFNFSPKLLSDNQNSPKFFTPTDKLSPRFFPESSPKSVYYDSVRSPKFFPDTPKSPAPNDNERRSLSPKAFTDLHNRNNSPKVYSPFEQLSPKVFLSGKPRSPKVYSFNKENYFDFDSANQTSNAEFTRQNTVPEEVDDVSRKPSYVQRYSGRKSIERERITPTEKLDIRKYRRHNSCDTYNRNLDNGNDNKFAKNMISYDDNIDNVTNNYNVTPKYEEQRELTEKGDDVLDCCVQIDLMTLDPESQEDCNKQTESLAPSHPNTEQQRRHRLKSISLDSDNAKIIEQNLGLPIAKHMKQDNLNEALQDYSASCCNVKRSGTCETSNVVNTKFKFDCAEISNIESKDFFIEESKYSPDLTALKKSLRDSSDTKSFIDMPRFSPKEFEVVITVDDESAPNNVNLKRKGNKNRNNLTIDLTRRDSDLEKELLEFEKLYTDSEDKKVKTPTLKIKATSLDSSDSINLSLPQQKTLEVPQNSVSVPNTPKRYMKRVLVQKGLAKGHEFSGGKMGYNSLQSDQRRFIKGQPVLLDSGIYLRENHANLMLYQPSTSRVNSRRMGSFDENMADFAENPPEINISNDCEARVYFPQQMEMSQSGLGSNLFKQNLSVSSTNLKTLPEGVPSNDFEPTVDEKISKKLHRRGSNQSLMISLDCNQPIGKYSTLSLQSSNCSLNSVGTSCHNLASLRNSASNFSLNTDNRQKKLTLERRNSNASLIGNSDHLTPITRIIGSSNANLQASNINLIAESQSQPVKNCLLQRRGSNNSLTLNIQNSNTNLARFSSNSSLNINKDVKCSQRKGLLERRSSNTSLTLNINNSNPQLTTNRALSISNYNLNGSTCNLSLHNSNQSIHNPSERKKGILERRSSNTSLTINIQGNENPRDIDIDENVLESNLKDQQLIAQRDKHRKSLSTENLLPKSYKNRVHTAKNNENQCLSFGSHDNLWSNSYVADTEEFQDNCGQNLTYVCGDQENEIIYAFGANQNFDASQGVVRNITTKPLSPQTTSEDFKVYLANIQHLQNASSVLTRKQLKDLNNIFQNGYSKVKCEGTDNNGHRCSPKGVVDLSKENPQMAFPETDMPCVEYQKSLLRNLHKEFWDLPLNFQEKPMVFGSHPKNRYKTILPNEHSRFILKLEGADNGESYVNANFIKGHEYTKNCYIATQGPLQNTIYDFWLMVHQNSTEYSNDAAKIGSADVQCQKTKSPEEKSAQKIVMLTNFIENNRQKCEKYFPLELNEEVVFENPGFVESVNFFAEAPKEETYECKNSFTITNKGMIKKPGYTIRRLHVLYRKGSSEELKSVSSDNVSCVRTDVELMSDKDETVKDIDNDREEAQNKAGETLKFAKKVNIITDIPKTLDENETIVYHYWFHNWADHKCPKDVNALLNLSLDVLKTGVYNFEQRSDDPNETGPCNCSANQPEPVTKFVFPPLDAPVCETSTCNSEHTVRKSALNFDDDGSPPIIVHCSAGIGRTGCLIAILNGIKQLNNDQKVDILGIVCNMRLNRGGMVQNSEQYELIHKVLCLYEQICLPNL